MKFRQIENMCYYICIHICVSMFGINFLKKNTTKNNTTETKATLNTTRNSSIFAELQDSVNMWQAQTDIEAQKCGVPTNVASMFTLLEIQTDDFPTEEIAPDTTENTHHTQETGEKNEHNADSTAEHADDTQNTPPTEDVITPPKELLPQSENDLVALVKDEYTNSIFFDKAHAALQKRNVPAENLEGVLDKLFTKMAQKAVATFTGDMLQLLNENGLNTFDAENYIYWRLNEYTKDNVMYLIADDDQETLIAENFITDTLLAQFYDKQEHMEDAPSDKDAENIVTSEKIDTLLDDINNI